VSLNVYATDGSRNVVVFDSVSGTISASLSLTIDALNAFASPNGVYVAVGTNIIPAIEVITTATNALNVITLPETSTQYMAWAPDSSVIYVAVSGASGLIQRVNPTGVGSLPPSWVCSAAGAGHLVTSSDGTKLYVTCGYPSVGVKQLNTATGAVTATYTGFLSTYGLCISPDDRTLYLSDNRRTGTVYQIDIASGTITTTITGLANPAGMCLSPDGSTLWVACNSDPAGGVKVIDTSTMHVTDTIFVATALEIAITPDGAIVWAADHDGGQVVPIPTTTHVAGFAVNVGAICTSVAIRAPAAGAPPASITGVVAVALGFALAAGGTVSGTPTGPGTVTGSGVLNIGPLTVTVESTYETKTATATVPLGPLVVAVVSGTFGPKRHPVPGYRGRWRLTLHTRSFAPATLASTIIAELSDARGRQLVQAWNTAATLTFTLDGHSQTAALIAELLHDVVAWRWDDQTGLEQVVFRGPISQSQDQLTEQSHVVTYTCHDYGAMLQRRLLTNTYTVVAHDQDLIVGDLLAAAVAARTSSGTSLAPASYLPLSLFTASPDGSLRGLSATLRNRTYYGSQNVGVALDELAKVVGGFDYDVTPSAVDTSDLLRIFYPQQGTTRSDVALQYGSTVSSLTRSVDSSQYANYVRALGNNSSANPAPQLFSEAWTASAQAITPVPVGLWMLDDNSGASDTVQSSLDERVQGDLNLDALLVPHYTLNMRPDAYTWGNPHMGDVVPLIVQSGRLNINTTVRVLGITYTIGDDGQEDVALVVSRPAQELFKSFLKAEQDAKALTRR
jgi:hypothetical protein